MNRIPCKYRSSHLALFFSHPLFPLFGRTQNFDLFSQLISWELYQQEAVYLSLQASAYVLTFNILDKNFIGLWACGQICIISSTA